MKNNESKIDKKSKLGGHKLNCKNCNEGIEENLGKFPICLGKHSNYFRNRKTDSNNSYQRLIENRMFDFNSVRVHSMNKKLKISLLGNSTRNKAMGN